MTQHHPFRFYLKGSHKCISTNPKATIALPFTNNVSYELKYYARGHPARIARLGTVAYKHARKLYAHWASETHVQEIERFDYLRYDAISTLR